MKNELKVLSVRETGNSITHGLHIDTADSPGEGMKALQRGDTAEGSLVTSVVTLDEYRGRGYRL